MNDVVYVVKSHMRVDRFRDKTYNNIILKYGFDLSKVFVFVSLDEDVNLYKKSYPKINIIKAPKGIAEVDNFITNYFNNYQKIIYMNDDVSAIKELNKDGKLSVIEKNKLIKITSAIFGLMVKNDITYAGFYPVANPFYMKNVPKLTFDFKLIMDPFSLVLNNKKIKITIGDKSDFEKSILHFLDKGALIRYNRISLQVEYYGTKGGFQGRNSKTEERTAKMMLLKYPDYISGIKTKKEGKTSLRFKKIKQRKVIKR